MSDPRVRNLPAMHDELVLTFCHESPPRSLFPRSKNFYHIFSPEVVIWERSIHQNYNHVFKKRIGSIYRFNSCLIITHMYMHTCTSKFVLYIIIHFFSFNISYGFQKKNQKLHTYISS